MSRPVRRPFRKLRAALILILPLVWGCPDDADYTKIDFSRRIETDRSETKKDRTELRVGVAAMVSPREGFASYAAILNYIGEKLGRKIRLIQKTTYGEMNAMFEKKEIDMAFICTGPYVSGREKYGFEALAAPIVRGSHFYQAYLIVNKTSPVGSLAALRGKTFAFTDPESNTGFVVPNYWLSGLGETPDSFFGQTIYTNSHDNSIMAAAKSLVDGASVHGHIWEYFNAKNPVHTSQTKIIRKSEPFGIHPVVVAGSAPEELKSGLREIFLSIHLDPRGRRILDTLLIDEFRVPEESWYESVREMYRTLSEKEGTHGPNRH